MSNDYPHHAFGNMTPNKAASQDAASSFNCSHCVLIFKTRIYLYEHLHQVHGLSVDSALKDSGLKSVPHVKSDTCHKLTKSKLDLGLKLGKSRVGRKSLQRKSDFAFNCKNCNFKSGNWAVYTDHKQQCSVSPNTEDETSKTKSVLGHTDSTSTTNEKAMCNSSSNDIKTYSGTTQTITKYFATTSTIWSDFKRNTEALRLEESSLNSSGVFQVAAKSIDLAKPSSTKALITDLDVIPGPTSAKSVDPYQELAPKNNGKRLANEDDECNPSKKTKLEITTPTSKLKTSSGELSLEFSDDEERNDLVGIKLEAIKVYKCKHCQYYATDLMHLVSHYEDSHPFISCNSIYIEEKSDQSATFRCLQCPVEFSVEAHLHAHYSNDHPNSPEIFSLKFADLVHKCFLCSFTSKILQSLKEHYKEKHPSEKVENPLWFCKYLSAQHDGYSTRRHISEVYKSPEKHETERTTAASLDERMAFTPKSHDATMYYCGKCPFSHKSVVVLHVHYKKCHPEEPITLDKIKLLNIPLPVAALEEKPGLEQDISHPFKISDQENKDQSVSQAVFNISPSSSPVEKMFFCYCCDFSNPNVKSVVGHHNAKHKTATTIEEVIRYTEEREKKNIVSVHNTQRYTYVSPLDLFYCKQCHYGNPALVGILNHQNKVHGFGEGKSDIRNYSTKIHDQIKKSQTHPNCSILPSGLPLPLIDGDTTLVFCQLCNYRHKDLSTVSRHYFKSHRGFRCKKQQIVEYTSMVYEWLNKSPQINQIEQKETVLEPEPAVEVKLKCTKCPYRTNYVHLMRKHLQALHKNTWLCSNIVELCGIAGAKFEPGYLCDTCNFCHDDLQEVKRHAVDRHGRYLSDKFLNRCMYLSPDVCDSSGTKKQDSSDDDDDNDDNDDDDDDSPVVEEEAPFDSYQMPLEFDNLNVPTQETKDFSCSYCSAKFEEHGGLWIHMGMKHRDEIEEMPQLEMDTRTLAFKCNSCSYVNKLKQGVATHALMKHPNKILKVNSIYVERENLKNVQLKMKMGMWKFCGFMCKECSQVYPSRNRLKFHRNTHKHGTSGSKNSGIYTCALCPGAFITLVRLRIHYTMKHGKAASLKYCGPLSKLQPKKVTAANFQHTPTEERMVLMYKCPSCRYVNSSPHGTLTHCQMRHPKLEVRAGMLKTLEIDLANMIGCHAERQNTFGGYRCRKCPKIFGGLAKLKIHCDRDHNSRGTTQVRTLAPESATSDPKKIFSKFRHFFKCSLCSFSTSILKQLGNHYMQRHGKSSYIKLYSPLLHQISKPKMPFKHEEIGQTKNPAAQAESKLKTSIPLQVYRCSTCSYGTSYRRYLIAHFKNRHKYDSQTVYKHMEKYKDYKPTLPSGHLNCKTCHDVFESTGRLLAHYQTIHSSEMHMDFIITAKRTERSTGIYRCNYCKNKINGIKNLSKHLDRHRARWLKKKDSLKSKVSEQNSANPIEESVERSEGPFAFSSQSFGEAEVSEEQNDARLTCPQCKRSFKSLKGMRSHERSHAAVAALDNATTSDSQEQINQYISYRPWTTRPYMCTLCSYRTTVISLTKNHIRRRHPHALNSAKVGKDLKEATQKDEAPQNFVNGKKYGDDDEPENSFLETPDVQRQLKHYNVMAQILPSEKTQNILLNEPRMFPCEMCNFNTQHYSAMRRHYLRRHGKKMMRCKYCDFFSCFKKNMDLHEQMGHSTVPSEPTHNKNLCCPFCFYQSKNKNNMIDHIVLHREERVMPIEVRRSKLSRYLQGRVFRCYKCTFTCGSADSLDSHMAKHNDLKPFKCRLCYFDCVQLRELEEHLCDKHQVVRNHQLVGQVCLDQVEAREDKNPQDDDDAGDDDDDEDDDDEMPCDLETEEQTINNEKNQHNKNQVAGAEQNHRNPESPKMQHVARRSLDPRFNNLAKYINGEKNFTQKPVEDKSEGSPVCMNEERDETQDNTQNAPLRMTPGNAPSSKIPTIHEEVHKDQHKRNSTADETFYGEMPILEKYFKEQCLVYAHSGETSSKPPCSSIMDLPPVLQSDRDVAFPSPAAVDTFPCDYCGRNFQNPSELERHMLRHRM